MLNKLEESRKMIDEIDREMADLFKKRMAAVKNIAEYKLENNLSVFDSSREQDIIDNNGDYCGEELKAYYTDFLKSTIGISKQYQRNIINKDSIIMNLGDDSYEIVVERGCLKKAGELLNLNRRVLVVTDSGVPIEYAKCVAEQCKDATIITVEQGEESKAIATYEKLLQVMLAKGFTRKDCVVAVGGGVVGDLSGFVAASYMRGVDFYNIPTTLLSQVDSSIGGKTAINFGAVKNIVGAFHQPKKVLVDSETLNTLPARQISNGMSEAVKMSLTFDEDTFKIFENEDIMANIDTIIKKSLLIKKYVVELDEKESGLRKVLNFGHTVGHAIEVTVDDLYHGEAVALGMLYMCSDEVKNRLVPVLKKLNLPTQVETDPEKILSALVHDKKSDGEYIDTVYVEKAGTFEMRKMKPEEMIKEEK